MDRWNRCIVLLCVCLVGACSAFEWLSSSTLADNASVPVCEGEDVEFHWNYTTLGEEHTLNVEWHYQPNDGSANEMLATSVAGHLFLDPAASKEVEYIPNAGILVKNVSEDDSGTYQVHVNINLHGAIQTHVQSVNLVVTEDPLVNGQLKAKLQGTRVDTVTGEEHLVLQCGKVHPLWASSLDVKWTTPSNETLPSTYDDKGNFLLTVPNPVQEGVYTCFIDDYPSTELCVSSDAPARKSAAVAIDGIDARLQLMDSEINAMKTEQAAKDQMINSLIEQLGNLTGQIRDFENSKAQMAAEIQMLRDANHNLTQALGDLQALKAELETLKATNEQLTQRVEEIPSIRTDVQALTGSNQHLTLQVAEIGTLKTQIQSLRAENANLTQQLGQVQALETRLQAAENATGVLSQQLQLAAKSISFQAHSDNRTYHPTDTVIFPSVLHNDGGAYDSTTGIFTAPVAGTYVFYLDAQITFNNIQRNDVWADLVVNDVSLIKIPTSYTDEIHVQGSGQAVVILKAGDRVWVKNQYSGAQYYDEATTFSGVLLHASLA